MQLQDRLLAKIMTSSASVLSMIPVLDLRLVLLPRLHIWHNQREWPQVCREAHEGELRVEDVTPNTASLLVFSRRGYLKRMRADLFSPQACPTSSFSSQSLQVHLGSQISDNHIV